MEPGMANDCRLNKTMLRSKTIDIILDSKYQINDWEINANYWISQSMLMTHKYKYHISQFLKQLLTNCYI